MQRLPEPPALKFAEAAGNTRGSKTPIDAKEAGRNDVGEPALNMEGVSRSRVEKFLRRPVRLSRRQLERGSEGCERGPFEAGSARRISARVVQRWCEAGRLEARNAGVKCVVWGMQLMFVTPRKDGAGMHACRRQCHDAIEGCGSPLAGEEARVVGAQRVTTSPTSVVVCSRGGGGGRHDRQTAP